MTFLADLHCDTAFELYSRSQSFYNNTLSISSSFANEYDNYLQIAAIWSSQELDNDANYKRFFKIVDYFKRDISQTKKFAVYTGEIPDNVKKLFILSVEDARLLNNDLDRLHTLYGAGVRFLTLLWRGETCIGGSFDTNSGLTDFGKATVNKCAELGIVPDVSHASLKSTDDIIDLCNEKSPIIASHSSSFNVFAHPRNLTDEHFKAIKNTGGLVGINLYADALGINRNEPALPSVVKNIEHYLSLGGEDTVCFGCDFDGTKAPIDIPNVAALKIIAERLAQLNYTNALIEKIFYKNVNNFMIKNIFK